MRASDRGFVAMVDAMIFIAVIILAASVTAAYSDTATDEDRDVSGFLEDLMESELFLEDLLWTGGDGSLVHVYDLCAVWLSKGGYRVGLYVEDVADLFAKGRPYTMKLTYENPSGSTAKKSIGSAGSVLSESCTKSYAVTAGGTLTVTLALYASRRLGRRWGTMSALRSSILSAMSARMTLVHGHEPSM